MFDYLNNIHFSNPYILILILLMPFVWKFLKTFPLAPKLTKFPAIILLLKNKSIDDSPDQNSISIVILRLLLLFVIILALSNPYYLRNQIIDNSEDNLIIIDNSWASSTSWERKINDVSKMIQSEKILSNTYTIFSSTELSKNKLIHVKRKSTVEALEFLNTLTPQPWDSNYDLLQKKLEGEISNFNKVYWLTEKNMTPGKGGFFDFLKQSNLFINLGDLSEIPPIIEFDSNNKNTYKFSIYSYSNSINNGIIDCFDINQRLIFRKEFEKESETYSEGYMNKVEILLPKDISNKVAFFQFNQINSPSTKTFLTKTAEKKVIGITSSDINSELQLDKANYYLRKGLEKNHEISVDSLENLLKKKIKLIIVDDSQNTYLKNQKQIYEWISNGGTLVKFGGENLIKDLKKKEEGFILEPLLLSSEVRSFEGELSISKLLEFSKFSKNSIFYNLNVPEDVEVRKYIPIKNIIESSSYKNVITLKNGEPILSMRKIKNGNFLFFHIPGNNDWSNLPLSIIFIDIFEKIIDESEGMNIRRNTKIFKPHKIISGLGDLVEPSAQNLNLDLRKRNKLHINYNNPPGIYKNNFDYYGHNIKDFIKTDLGLFKPVEKYLFKDFEKVKSVELKSYIYLVALLIFLFENIITYKNRGLISFSKKFYD